MGLFGFVYKLGGLLFLAYLLFNVGSSVYKRNFYEADWEPHRGEWAIVTGASSGIGRAVALNLASRGINVLVLARREALLQSLVEEITGQFKGVKADYFVANVLSPDVWDAMAAKVHALDGPVSVLVNNVGGGDGVPMPFHEMQMEDFDRTLTLNQNSFVRATAVVLPGMVKRNKGRIINISSVASLGVPYLASYSMAKNTMNVFAKVLNGEMAGVAPNVRAESVITGLVSTALIGHKEPSFDTCTPERMAADTLRYWGLEEITCPYIGHLHGAYLGPFLPPIIRYPVMRLAMKQIIDLNVASKQKKAATAAEAKTEL